MIVIGQQRQNCTDEKKHKMQNYFLLCWDISEPKHKGKIGKNEKLSETGTLVDLSVHIAVPEK